VSSAGAGADVDVVTVTPNPAIDHTAWVPGFVPGEVNRVTRDHLVAGGKGVNVAAMLAGWGLRTLATGFLGAENAGTFASFLAERGISERFVTVPGLTRTGVKVVDEVAGTTTDLNFPGFTVGPDHVAALGAALGDVAVPGRWVVLAGSLPVGAPATLHRDLAEVVRARGGLVALDTSGPALAAAVAGGPDLVKPNREELEELTGRTLRRRADVVDAARALAGGGIATVVVSLGADGAIFVRDGEAVFATPPPVVVASTVGAGDAMVAGTVAGTLRGLPLAEVAALATAFSAVAVSRVGAQLDPDAAMASLQHTTVEALP
jgi:1-phosphofructokinase